MGGKAWICGGFLRRERVAIWNEVWFRQVLPELDEQAVWLLQSSPTREPRGQGFKGPACLVPLKEQGSRGEWGREWKEMVAEGWRWDAGLCEPGWADWLSEGPSVWVLGLVVPMVATPLRLAACSTEAAIDNTETSWPCASNTSFIETGSGPQHLLTPGLEPWRPLSGVGLLLSEMRIHWRALNRGVRSFDCGFKRILLPALTSLPMKGWWGWKGRVTINQDRRTTVEQVRGGTTVLWLWTSWVWTSRWRRGRCDWYTNKVFRERSRLNLHVVCEVLRLDKQSSMVAAVSFVCTASTLWEFWLFQLLNDLILILFKNFFFLRCSWFTVSCRFQVYSTVIQLCVCVCAFSDSFPL